MASCTQIERLFQAYIDGELSSADCVVLEQHTSSCQACAEVLRKQHHATAVLFETLRPQRLARSLRGPIMENLPEMDRRTVDLAGVNWRAKNPVSWKTRMARLMPIAVMIMLVIALFIIREQWPQPDTSGMVVGVVSQANGNIGRVSSEETEQRQAALTGDFIEAGTYFTTGPGTTLMVSLMGPSYVKVNENTRLRVESDRRIKIEQGEAWFNVGRDGRVFRVATPNGNVTVLGTTFLVKVIEERTIVTVQSGAVKVENETPIFRVVKANQQVLSMAGQPVSAPETITALGMAEWADRIHPEENAETLFANEVMPHSKATELTAKELYWVNTSQGGRSWTVSAVRLGWGPSTGDNPGCAYTVYIYDDKGSPLQKEYLPATVFSDKEQNSYEILIKDRPLGGIGNLMVEIVPENPAIKREFKVSASGV